MALIENLVVALGLKSSGFDSKLSKSKKHLSSFEKATHGVKAGLASMAVKATAFFAAFAGISAVSSRVSQAMNRLDEVGKTADKLGIATEHLIALRYAAGQMAGMGTGQFSTALQRMVRRISEASQGTGEAQKSLQRLGLDAKQLNTLSPDKQIRKIADAMSAVSRQSDKVQIASKLFDSEGVAMVNVLRGGSAALDEMYKKAEQLGLLFSRMEIAKIEAANDAWDDVSRVLDSVYARIGVDLAPAVILLSKELAKMTEGTSVFGKTFLDISEVMISVIGTLTSSMQAFSATITIAATKLEMVMLSVGAIFGGLGAKKQWEDAAKRHEQALQKLEDAIKGKTMARLKGRLAEIKKEFIEMSEAIKSGALDLGDEDTATGRQTSPAALQRGTSEAAEMMHRVGGSQSRSIEFQKTQAEKLSAIYERAVDIDRRLETIEIGFGGDAAIA